MIFSGVFGHNETPGEFSSSGTRWYALDIILSVYMKDVVSLVLVVYTAI